MTVPTFADLARLIAGWAAYHQIPLDDFEVVLRGNFAIDKHKLALAVRRDDTTGVIMEQVRSGLAMGNRFEYEGVKFRIMKGREI